MLRLRLRCCLLLLCTSLVAACERAPSEATTTRPSGATNGAASARRQPPTIAAGLHYTIRHSGGAQASEALPLVVAIHGLGDEPKRFSQLLDGVNVPARLVFPRGLSSYHAGFSWFELDGSSSLHRAVSRLAAMLAALRKRYPTVGKPIVTGFSQGGVLSFALAVAHPEQVALALPIAGWLPPALLPRELPSGAPPIVALHGDGDTRLPVGSTRNAVGTLKTIGFNVELIEYPGVGHTVSAAMRRELYRRLGEALAKR